jgi:hypothetical protein
MAIIKFINNKVSLKKTLNYICKEEKTDKKLISGKDCIPEMAYEEMMTVKKMYKKLTGREKIHFVQSFSPNDKLTYEQAHEIGVKMAEYFKGFQVVVATHIDREHIHNHIVLNTVNFETGLKFHQSKQDLQKIKELSNKICKEYGLTVTEQKSKVADIKINEYQARIKGISWKEVLTKDIDSVMEKSNNKYEFFRGMNELGYKVNWSREKLSIIYTTPTGYKCSDKKLHKEKYLRENMELYFKEKSRKNIQGVKQEKITYKSIHSNLADIIEQLSRNKQTEDTTTLTGLNESAKKQLAIEMHYSTEELDEIEF